ncbi:MAG: hypothetical protein WBK13_05805, partial [Limnochordia bacterium]
MTEPIIIKKPKKPKKPRKARNLGLYIFTLAVMAAIAFAAYRYFAPEEERFVLNFYTYAEVGTMDFIDRITTGGTVVPETTIEVKAPATAAVVEILAFEGGDVSAGAPLLRLYSQKLHDSHAKAAADLKAAQEALAQLLDDQAYELTTVEEKIAKAQQDLDAKQANHELQATLYSYGVIAKVDLDKAAQEVALARQALRAAERERETTLRTQDSARKQAEKNVTDCKAELDSLTE